MRQNEQKETPISVPPKYINNLIQRLEGREFLGYIGTDKVPHIELPKAPGIGLGIVAYEMTENGERDKYFELDPKLGDRTERIITHLRKSEFPLWKDSCSKLSKSIMGMHEFFEDRNRKPILIELKEGYLTNNENGFYKGFGEVYVNDLQDGKDFEKHKKRFLIKTFSGLVVVFAVDIAGMSIGLNVSEKLGYNDLETFLFTALCGLGPSLTGAYLFFKPHFVNTFKKKASLSENLLIGEKAIDFLETRYGLDTT